MSSRRSLRGGQSGFAHTRAEWHRIRCLFEALLRNGWDERRLCPDDFTERSCVVSPQRLHCYCIALSDNIAAVVWIGAALTIGWLLALGWVTAICSVVTCAAILLKDCWLDPAPDWRDIWAGLLGLAWALAKIGLLWLCWRLLH